MALCLLSSSSMERTLSIIISDLWTSSDWRDFSNDSMLLLKLEQDRTDSHTASSDVAMAERKKVEEEELEKEKER